MSAINTTVNVSPHWFRIRPSDSSLIRPYIHYLYSIFEERLPLMQAFSASRLFTNIKYEIYNIYTNMKYIIKHL